MSDGLTHLNADGEAHMVDVGQKAVTRRTAVAEAHVTMTDAVKAALFAGALPKGDAVAVVRVAAIMGAKRTPDLVPLCHPIGLDAVEAGIEPTPTGARIIVTAQVEARTGVEMEAMTGAAVGAVALYDMIKGLDRGASIGPIQLLSKTGGKSGDWVR
jgi:cyclic pyranopterin phosphate synthase